jgi:cation-transporting ATPase E
MPEPEPQALAPDVTDPALGLTSAEASRRLAAGRGNTIPRTTRSNWEIVWTNFITPFNVILVVLGVTLATLGAPLDALFTTGVMFFNVAIAVFQELRARHKLEQIALLAKPHARVLRDGQELDIDPSEVVLGDVVVAAQGDEIVVDGPLLEGTLELDESLLTGESDGVHKSPGDEVKSGSAVLSGAARYEAARVGADSYASQLTVRARAFQKRVTPIQREVDTTVRVLLLVVAFYVSLLALGNVLQHGSLLDFARATAVVFQIAPPGLFLVIVLAYALGAARIADEGVVVQQVESVESLCRVEVLCLDKTGTLTTNRFALAEVLPVASGVSPDDARSALGVFAASVTAPNKTSETIAAAVPSQARAPVAEVAFSSGRKWSAVGLGGDDALAGTWVLGAPEMIQPGLADGDAWDPDGTATAWQREGMRVLLLARAQDPAALGRTGDEDPRLPAGLASYAVVALSDELRPDAAETLTGFAEAGIELKVISGDNPDTVTAIAARAGLKGVGGEPLRAVSGATLDTLDDEAFDRIARSANVFGRVTPEQKERLVDSLHRAGRRVAMTGDGVNDVLALKKADVGIAMQSGSIATRNSADIVLLGDRFAALPGAFKEGQRIVRGITAMLEVYLTRIVTFIVILAAVMSLAKGFPFLPRQRSLITMVTLTLPNIFLAWWAPPGRVPRGSLMRRIGHFLLPTVSTAVVVQVAVFFGYLAATGDMALARDVLALLTLTIGLAVIPFVAPPSAFWNVSGQGAWNDWRPTVVVVLGGLALTALILFTPWLAPLFQFEVKPLPVQDYLWVLAATLAWMGTVWVLFRTRFMERFLRLDEQGSEK